MKQTEEIVLAGNLNGHVGAEREEYERWHEGKTLGQRNEERKMELDMVRANDVALVNKFFTKSSEQTYKYKSGQNGTVIDYIALRRDISGNVVNCKVILGGPVTRHHRLLVMGLKISKKRRVKRIRGKRTN